MSALRTGLTLCEDTGADAPVDPTVDPRIAVTGGRRRRFGDAKSNYEWDGMMSQPHWLATKVHKATRHYACAWCGCRFKTPNGYYTHAAKAHGR
jgi:hypothetical protein